MLPARPSVASSDPDWAGWGERARVPVLSETVLGLLADGLGVEGPRDTAAAMDAVALAPIRLPASVAEELRAVVGDAHALADDEARLRHTRGKSTLDLLRLRAGEAADAPDLVLIPGSHEEILEVLRICSGHAVAVVPFGGGTSVVGGLEPDRRGFAGVVALDLRRLNALVELDEVSKLAVLEPGLRGPQAEALLGEHGYTLGHFPQSFEYATLGGFAAARSSGQASAGYGRFDDQVQALTVATPVGTLKLGRAPKSAAGPDLRQLILGSEGSLGVITSLTVRIRPAPQRRIYEGWRLAGFAAGIDVVRRLAQDGPLPTVLRLSDEAETALNLARPGAAEGGCLAIVGYEGVSDAGVEAQRDGVSHVLAAAGASPVAGAGEEWLAGRFAGPYLREALLDAGAFVETLETATFWSSLPALYHSVSTALRDALRSQGTPPVVLCHVSHVYATGASLYFTVACARLDDTAGQWQRAKAAASEAILAADGSISHHHGVGVDHVEWHEREVGELGVRMLRAVKRELDPAGILNPGVLMRRT